MALAEALASTENKYVATMSYQYVKDKDIAIIEFKPVESSLAKFFDRIKFKKIKVLIKDDNVQQIETDYNKIKWVYGYVLENVEYGNLDNVEDASRINNALFNGKTRCYEYSTLIKAFLDEFNIDNKLIGGKVYNLDKEGNKSNLYDYQMHG